MANILALDTSGESCTVALRIESNLFYRRSDEARQHTKLLLPLVDELLSEAGVSLNDLDAIAFGCGPGSFTGLRICLGVVQGLAFGCGCKVIPVSTLMAMAQGASREGVAEVGQTVVAALDARMSEIYTGIYRITDTIPKLAAGTQECVSPPAEVALDDFSGVIGVGSGWSYSELSREQAVTVKESLLPDAADIIVVAEEMWQQGLAQDVMSVEPVYLRNEVTWKKRERIRAQ
ncbi:tRNA (adenosine(37)-N6)-threonylcarbamoyltransferase complex dimerization subunit type 1 TsaB [Marinibactrum halimedae]|uniref:tRNA threonylcarbamoyladenosine biosynthesis protein TsaB n=1 Tax=Marinibactrum halimedae TaxID=1444977 RepID=A0AA37WMR2_9GAMM|nr:tRNA (adenosine(37)-N6)-threonylcarbamoyltransferase complex dimerization subunit type 1 TsaB [Marinibactrum halimedae]MCD9458521.1 tRNA (adenosine(37)-N6)-threonylcarbamoyltransferase complex dimerization subunit type 1 TsaB [Marinibactrum halimedae]GLS26615.1 tRNA threonylcarbamoyladenosine biosynthesis protein TsaB [Marinibactrum halimedae]